MRKNAILSELLLTLLFASVLVAAFLRLLAFAYEESRQSGTESAALIALEDTLELCKAEGETLCAGTRLRRYDADFAAEAQDGTAWIETRVREEKTPAGTLFKIEAAAFTQTGRGEKEIASLQTALYRKTAEENENS